MAASCVILFMSVSLLSPPCPPAAVLSVEDLLPCSVQTSDCSYLTRYITHSLVILQQASRLQQWATDDSVPFWFQRQLEQLAAVVDHQCTQMTLCLQVSRHKVAAVRGGWVGFCTSFICSACSLTLASLFQTTRLQMRVCR